MRARFRRAAIAVSIVTVILPISFAAIILTTAWNSRLHAARLLAVAKEIQPGTTTESQAREALKPFAKYDIVESQGGNPSKEAEYEFLNVPPWHVSGQTLTFLRWTRFAVDVRYRDGIVTELHVSEGQQEHPGYVHPVAASVRIYSAHYEFDTASVPYGFRGYWIHSQHTSGLSNGQFTGFHCCEEEFTVLDERASPEQLAQSLNFNLSCLSSIRPCDEPRKIRPPIR